VKSGLQGEYDVKTFYLRLETTFLFFMLKLHEARYIKKNSDVTFIRSLPNGNKITGAAVTENVRFTYFGDKGLDEFEKSLQST
jgi:hypothetical protein